MELNTVVEDTEYATLLNHIDDLKKICEKLNLNLNLLEIPIQHAARSHVLPVEFAMIEPSSESSDVSSSSDDSDV